MYKTLWNYLKEHVKREHRTTAFLSLLTVGWSVAGVLAGLIVCLGIQKELMIKLTVILCAGGYAGLILGFFGGIFFLYKMDLRKRFADRAADKENAAENTLVYLTNHKAV